MDIDELIAKLIAFRDGNPECKTIEIADQNHDTYNVLSVTFDPGSRLMPAAIVINVQAD